ncbi:hypothetical protein [Streptomyces sp. NRRL B-3229]|uniref:hypothetical protein n=1 Tax=Streptomyces sp. NRRL B-3229 TaxID=1463836 RepID=UPI0004C1BADB|nr:hypothetical protein [Streptomyces sp. NRRL B-3229]
MRRTTHRTTLALAALTLLAGAGCGSQAGSDGGGADTVSPPPSSSASPSPSSSPRCTSASELGASDSGATVCLAVGDTVRLSLDGTKSRPWSPVTAEGTGLEPVNSGFVLQPGDANAAYRAVSAGQVRLTSSRPLCATETGKVSCKGIQGWWVTVVITGA